MHNPDVINITRKVKSDLMITFRYLNIDKKETNNLFFVSNMKQIRTHMLREDVSEIQIHVYCPYIHCICMSVGCLGVVEGSLSFSHSHSDIHFQHR